jgi:hypothetical protein
MRPEHFPEKWSPVFRQKMRPLKKIGTLSDSIESESVLARIQDSILLSIQRTGAG